VDIYKKSDLYNRSTGKKEGTHQVYDYTICDYCGEKLPDKMFDDECLTTTFYKIYETAMIEPWNETMKKEPTDTAVEKLKNIILSNKDDESGEKQKISIIYDKRLDER